MSGFIDETEFVTIMLDEFCRNDAARGELYDASTKLPYVIPRNGFLNIDMFYQCEKPSIYDVSHDEGIMSLIKAIHYAKSDDQRHVIFNQATKSPYYYMSASQAMMLFEEMSKYGMTSNLEFISRMLPQIVNSDQCKRFVDACFNEQQQLALRVMMGTMYNAFMGLVSGHYCFDLKDSQRKIEGRVLSAFWSEENKIAKAHGIDTSQRGNFSSFRNEGNLIM